MVNRPGQPVRTFHCRQQIEEDGALQAVGIMSPVTVYSLSPFLASVFTRKYNPINGVYCKREGEKRDPVSI